MVFKSIVDKFKDTKKVWDGKGGEYAFATVPYLSRPSFSKKRFAKKNNADDEQV